MKERLDVLLAKRGLAPSREAARRLIMAGVVYAAGQKCDKPGLSLPDDAEVTVRGGEERYVSRGGTKLEQALRSFPISLEGRVCMDIGASTGGFTDCMLQNGAVKVYAVDVGYGQLAWKLREDPRVVNLERTNIRYLDPALVPEPVDFISIDVSFISLRLVLPVAKRLLAPGGAAVALIKPQFEAGRGNVGKKGVVRDRDVHESVVRQVCAFAGEAGLPARLLTYSPIKGPQGNIEYLAYLGGPDGLIGLIGGPEDVFPAEEAARLVDRSHERLDQKGGDAPSTS